MSVPLTSRNSWPSTAVPMLWTVGAARSRFARSIGVREPGFTIWSQAIEREPPREVSIQVTAVPALWPGHVCSPGDSGQAEDVGACPVGQVGAGNGGVHGLWVIASRSAVMMSTRCLAAVEM